jgi:hypothetical protein
MKPNSPLAIDPQSKAALSISSNFFQELSV